MTYCTIQQLTDRYSASILVRLTDIDDVPTGVVDTDKVDRAIADTDALIDGSVSVRYQLPLDPLPAIIVDLALQIAIYKLHTETASEKITADYKMALAALDKISTGKVRLKANAVEAPTAGGSSITVVAPDRIFNRDSLKGL